MNKTRIGIHLLLLAPAALVSQAHAAERLETWSGYTLGVQASGYQYTEPSIMELRGKKLGLTAQATDNLGDRYYAATAMRYAFGKLNYTSPISGLKNDNPDYLLDWTGTGGRDYVSGKYALSPYAGIGYRVLLNDLRGQTSAGASGYRRLSQYWYVPVGVTHRMGVGGRSLVSTNIEYEHLVYGTQKSYLTDFDPAYPAGNPVNRQRKGYGFKLSTAFEQDNWSLGVFYYHWDVRESETNYYALPQGGLLSVKEPSNSTNEYGVQFKYRL